MVSICFFYNPKQLRKNGFGINIDNVPAHSKNMVVENTSPLTITEYAAIDSFRSNLGWQGRYRRQIKSTYTFLGV